MGFSLVVLSYQAELSPCVEPLWSLMMLIGWSLEHLMKVENTFFLPSNTEELSIGYAALPSSNEVILHKKSDKCHQVFVRVLCLRRTTCLLAFPVSAGSESFLVKGEMGGSSHSKEIHLN